MTTIDPQPASGFRDYLPEDAAARQKLMDILRRVFERSGFSPIETPALERMEVLTGGDEAFAKQIYRARITDEDAETIALRFDLTVPLARFVAAHANDILFPFRRYQIGTVWRGEHAQAGRYREFVQCDVDIMGSASPAADADVIATVHQALDELGAHEHTIRVNDRRILNGLLAFSQIESAQGPAVLRVMDKLEKDGWDSVVAELRDSLKLDETQTDSLKAFLDISGGTNAERLDRAHELLKFSPEADAGIHTLRTVLTHCTGLGVPDGRINVDFSVARGLGYYTGPVFETYLDELPGIGSVASGGRYDSLVSRFAPLDIAATGMSIGFDRLVAALDQLKLLERAQTGARAIVFALEPEATDVCLKLVTDLRNQDISAELYIGHETNLKGMLAYAVKRSAPYVVIVGRQELDNKTAQVKNMSARTQEEIPLAEVASRIRA